MNNTFKSIIWLVVIVVVIWAGYQAFFAKKAFSESIRIGVLLPLSGPAAYHGGQSKTGIEIAERELLKAYPGLKLELIYEDSLYTPKGGVDAYQKLRNTGKLDAVMTAASQVSIPVSPLALEDGILQMAIFSSADKYTSPDDLTFRISTRSDIESGRTADLIKERGYRKLAILYLNNDFGVSFKDALKTKLSEKGAVTEIIAEEGYLLENNDFRTQLTKVKAAVPDAVYIVGTAQHYANILKQAKELALNVQFIGMRAAEDPVILAKAAVEAEGLIYTYPFDAASDSKQVVNLATATKERNVVVDAFTAEGYEGLRLVVGSFIECGKDYTCIKSWLQNLKDYETTFGKISFDKNGDVYYDYFYKTVRNGQFVRL